MPLTNLQALRSTVGAWSEGLREYVVQYRATMSSVLDGPAAVLASAGVPFLFQTTYSYGTDIDTQAICVEISAPRRAANDTSRLIWIFNAVFRYDRSKVIEHQPVIIQPFYRQTQEPVTRAQFNGWFQYIGSGANWSEVTKTNPKLIKNVTRGPITNSAGIAILPAPEKPVTKKGYFVSWHKRTHFDFEPYINTINLSSYTLVAYDKVANLFEAGTASTIFNKTFSAGTLLLADVQTEVTEIYGRNVYKYTLEFHEDDHDLYELDRGLSEQVASGDDDGRDGTFTTGDFPDGVPKIRRIEHPGGAGPISEPMLLNGEGKLLPDQKPEDAIYLKWGIFLNSNFADLPIGTTT